MVVAYLLCLIAVFGYGIAAVLQAKGMRAAMAANPDQSFKFMGNPFVLAGLVLDFVSWGLSRVALGYLPLFAVQTVLAGSIAVTTVAASLMLGTKLSRTDRWAVIAMCVAITVVGAAAAPVVDDVSPPAYEPYLLAALPVLLVLGLTVARRWTPVFEAVLAGIAFVCSAMAARLVQGHLGIMSVLTSPFTWAVVGHTLVGIWLHTRAMGRGGAGQITAVMWSTEVVVATVVGLVAFGESVRSGWAIPVALAIITVLVATVVLARTSAEAVEARTDVEAALLHSTEMA